MKKLLLLFLIISFTVRTNAQTSDRKWAIGGGIGAYRSENISGVGIPEIYVSKYLNRRFDIIFKCDANFYNSNLKSKLDFVNTLLNLRFKLSGETVSLRPYLFAGPGYLWDNSISAVNFDFGLGTKYYISQSTSFYMEAGYFRGLKSTTYDNITGRENLWKFTIGIEFDLGKGNGVQWRFSN